MFGKKPLGKLFSHGMATRGSRNAVRDLRKLAGPDKSQAKLVANKAAVRAGRPMNKTMGFMGRHKKAIGGGIVAGAAINGVMSRSGRAADRPNGRPTGPYMY